MATQADLIRERELLVELGLLPVKVWPPRCTWYQPDGSVAGKLPCDPYSRLLYMGRGLRPEVGTVRPSSGTKTPSLVVDDVPASKGLTLVDALTAVLQDRETWEGTASELLSRLSGITDDLPVDATRMSKAVMKLASTLASRGIAVERVKRGKDRGIRLRR